MTPLSRSSSSPRRATAWGRLLGLLGLVLLAASCSKDVTSIGVNLPAVDGNTGAYLVDTLTVRASTVLRDSVVTSTSSSLVLGRYTDPQLGTVQATSYFGVGLNSSFTPDNTLIYDSLVLVLSPTSGTSAYRYGDTTRTQHLVPVYKLTQVLSTTKPLFAAPKYTPLAGTIDNQAGLQNYKGILRVRKASPVLGALRMRLNDALGQQLMTAGQRGLITTQDQLQGYLPGLAIVPDPSDNAALLNFTASSDNTALFIYYHDPTTPATVQSTAFPVGSGGAHCFQVELLNRGQSVLGSRLPTQPLGAVKSENLMNETVIQGGLGFQTKLEIPYLRDLFQLGQRITITNAQLVLVVPNSTTSTTLALAPPTSLRIATSNLNNQPISQFSTTVGYTTRTSPTTTLQEGIYSLPNEVVNNYIQAILGGTYTNNGLLVAPTTNDLPYRVVLGDSHNPLSKLQLRLYVISPN